MAEKHATRTWVIVTISLAALVGVVLVVYLNNMPSKSIGSYKECTNAGGTVTQTYPEQCTINGKTFTNTSSDSSNKSSTSQPNDYIGLSEQAALDKAKSENTPARVVKRDGEELPTTMDYAQGRLDLTISDGKVEKVDIE